MRRGGSPIRDLSTAPHRFRFDVARPVPRFLGFDDPVRIVTQPDLPEFDRGDAGPSLNRIRHRAQRRALEARQRIRAGRPLLGDEALRRIDDLRRARGARVILEPREGFVPGAGRVGVQDPDADSQGSLRAVGPAGDRDGRAQEAREIGVIGSDAREPGDRERFRGGVIGGDP